MKKGNWFKGELMEGWKSKTMTVRKRAFLMDGSVARNKNTTNTTVVFVPTTKGGLLVRKLKEEQDRTAEVTGFRTKYPKNYIFWMKDMYFCICTKIMECVCLCCSPWSNSKYTDKSPVWTKAEH